MKEEVDIRPIWIRPSGANLWADPEGCWASATFEPPEKGSEETPATLRGTRLHEAVASIIDPMRRRPLLQGGEWNLARGAVSELERHVAVDSYEWKIEDKISRTMGEHDPGSSPYQAFMDGTPDLVGLTKGAGWRGKQPPKDSAKMVIVDWKFGRIPVDAADNRQLLAYAVMHLYGNPNPTVGWARKWHWDLEDEILTIIVQPAMAEVFEPFVKTARYKYKDILEERDRLDSLVSKMRDLAVPVEYNPTVRNCRYCEGARQAKCPVMAEVLDLAEDYILMGRKPIGEGLTTDKFAKFLRRADLVACHAKSVREVSATYLKNGVDVQGLKLVQTRAGNRRWKDEEAAAGSLHEHVESAGVDIWEPVKLKSPAAIVRTIKAATYADDADRECDLEIVDGLVERSEPTLAIVPEDDPRDSVVPSPDTAKQVFKSKRKEAKNGQEAV